MFCYLQEVFVTLSAAFVVGYGVRIVARQRLHLLLPDNS